MHEEQNDDYLYEHTCLPCGCFDVDKCIVVLNICEVFLFSKIDDVTEHEKLNEGMRCPHTTYHCNICHLRCYDFNYYEMDDEFCIHDEFCICIYCNETIAKQIKELKNVNYQKLLLLKHIIQYFCLPDDLINYVAIMYMDIAFVIPKFCEHLNKIEGKWEILRYNFPGKWGK